MMQTAQSAKKKGLDKDPEDETNSLSDEDENFPLAQLLGKKDNASATAKKAGCKKKPPKGPPFQRIKSQKACNGSQFEYPSQTAQESH